LNLAVAEGKLEFVKILIGVGADCNACSWFESGTSILEEAILTFLPDYMDVLEIMKELVDAGADINHKNCHLWAPLHRACLHPRQVSSEITEFLIHYGADVNSEDKNW